MTGWPMLLADFRREYGITSAELGDLPLRDFWRYVAGLSDRSVWRAWARQQSSVVEGEAEVSRILSSL